MEKLNKILTDALNAYNETNAAMNVRNEGKAEGIADAKEPMYDFFISKVKRNLHVCLYIRRTFRARGARSSRTLPHTRLRQSRLQSSSRPGPSCAAASPWAFP